MTNVNWPTMTVAVQFSGSTWTDITSSVLGVHTARGRNYELGQARAGSLSIQLNNSSGNFDPSNTGGAYYPNVLLFKPIRVQVTWATVTTTIWSGYVTNWPQSYLDHGNWQLTPLQATDILGVLKQKVFLSGFEEKINQQGPTYWWTMSSQSGQANVVQERVAGVQNGRVATFGGNSAVSLGSNSFATEPLGLEGSGGASFTPAKPGYGFPSDMSIIRFLRPLNGNFFPWPSVPWTLTFVLQGTTRPSTDDNFNPSWFLEWTDSGGGNGTGKTEFIRFGVSQKGLFYAQIRDANGSIFSGEFTTQLADGLPHVISIEFSGAHPNFYYTVDGLGFGTMDSGNANGWIFDQIVVLNVGGSWPTNAAATSGYAGTISELAWFGGQQLVTAGTSGHGTSPTVGPFSNVVSNADSLPMVGINAWSGQTSDQRIQSLMTLAGYGSKFTSLGTGQAVLQGAVIAGKDVASTILEVGTTEGGVVFVRGDGNVVFSPRAFRYAPAAGVTLGDGTNYPMSSLELSYDTQQVVTQAEVTRRNGNNCISINTAQVTALGLFTNQISDSGETTDNQCFAHAQYITGFFGAPTIRAERLSVDMGANPAAFALIAAMDINTCIQLNHTPLGGHAVSLLLWVESMNFTITPDSFVLSFDAVPADQTAWLTADTSTKNTLDNSGLKLSF